MDAAVTQSSVHRATDRPWVLITDHVNGRSRSAVAAVRAVAVGGYRPVVTVSGGGRSAAAASRECAATVVVPGAVGPGYRAAVDRELRSRPYATVLPASDAALVALGRSAALVDKASLPERVAAAGMATPATTEFACVEQLRGAAHDLDYPLVVKPAVKLTPTSVAMSAGSPAELISLTAGLGGGTVVVQPFLTGRVRAVSGVLHGGELRAVAHQRYVRTWPVDCGTASYAVTTGPDHTLEACLPALLSGHEGVFQVQLVEDLVIDVNPRVYGSLPLAVAAGANLPAVACAAAAGHSGALVRARHGVPYRWVEGDARHLVQAVRTGEASVRSALRALRPRPGTAHSVESLRDPGPGLVRIAEALGPSRR